MEQEKMEKYRNLSGEIDDKLNEFKKYHSKNDAVLKALFTKKMPCNKKYEDVLIKVMSLNTLYSTQINKYDICVISELICEEKNIDELLRKGDFEAVNLIGQTKPGINNAYVFASKYCSFHNPTLYPIFDSRSWLALKILGEELNLKFNLENNPTMNFSAYKKYYNCIKDFKEINKLPYDFKELDEYLWLKGKEYISIK